MLNAGQNPAGPTGPAAANTAATLGWFLTWWFAVPARSRIRHAADDDTTRPAAE